jgi:hypothetical protein
MRRIALLVGLFLVGLTTTSAFAKDLCVVNAFGQLVKFDKVQVLKGKTTVLAGRFHGTGGDPNVPFNGAVTLDSDNVTTRIGILAYPVAGGGISVAFSEYMIGDKDFNATGSFDNSPFSGTDGADIWTSVSCATPFPPASAIISPVRPAPGIP